MKKIFYILIYVTILSCTSINKNKTEIKSPMVEKATELDSLFNNCFSKPKSDFVQSVVGCSYGYYKVINDKYVLRISLHSNIDYNQCEDLINNSLNQNFIAELLIFEKGKANITNTCTDVMETYSPQPIKILKKCIGKITIWKSDLTGYSENERPMMTIQIDNLIFIDSYTNEKIEIKNELFWKVENIGLPG